MTLEEVQAALQVAVTSYDPTILRKAVLLAICQIAFMDGQLAGANAELQTLREELKRRGRV